MRLLFLFFSLIIFCSITTLKGQSNVVVDNLLHSGVALYRAGDYPRAEKLLRRAIERAQEPRQPDELAEAHCFLAESLFSLNLETEAVHHFRVAEHILANEINHPESRPYYYRILLGLATTATEDTIRKAYYNQL
ncbi:MAG: hypothetical protein AAFU67_12455, partial [Bacteroidota bacterium]